LLVSVVIPAYNAEPYIAQTIESVLAQTYPRVEVIVADDGSTDGTRQCVRAFGARVRYLRHPNSGGAARPRNLGISAARGDLIAFVDADDLMLPGRIAAAVGVLEARRDAALVLTNFQNFDDRALQPIDHFQTCRGLRTVMRERGLGGEAFVLPADVSAELLLSENFGSSAPIVRRRAIEAVGGYDETTPPSEDFDFNYRIASRFPIAILPQVLLHKRAHGDNLSSNLPRLLGAQILVRSRMLREATDRGHRRALRRLVGGYYRALAYHYTGRDNALAVRYELMSMRFSWRPSVKQAVRIAADLVGRDTLKASGRPITPRPA
jgi:glycosyltransferase involved in cell wall biosynthesis